MPLYEFKCPCCKLKVFRSLPRKRMTLRDTCNAGRRHQESVTLKYIRTVPR